jgi:arabinofuranosyltransferase
VMATRIRAAWGAITRILGPQDESVAQPPARLSFRLEHVLLPALAIAAAAFWLRTALALTPAGFPLDDAWIHLQFARNIAEGHGVSFNPGVPSSGSTAPLWTLALAPLLALGVAPVAAAIGLGLALTCATVVATTEFTRLATGSRGAGIVAGAAVALSGRVVWAAVSGMEGPLFAFLTVAALLAYMIAVDRPGDSWGLWGALAGLAGAARPEAFVVVPMLAAHWVLGPGAAGRRVNRRAFLKPFWLLALVTLAYVALNYHGGGHPLPMTFYAKTEERSIWHAVTRLDFEAIRQIGTWPLTSLNKMLLFFMGQSALLFAAALVGILALADVFGPRFRAGASLLVAVLLATPILKGLLAPTPSILVHVGRYITHLTVLFLIAATIGLFVLHRLSRRRWVVPVLALVALARLGAQDMREARIYAQWVKNINDLQVVAGTWIAEHTSEDAVVATNDIGAVAYFSGRPIVDTEGLVTSEAIPFKRTRNLAGLLERAKPDLLVIFPEWYPDIAGSPILTEVRRFSARKVVAGGPELVVYTLPWTRPGRVH